MASKEWTVTHGQHQIRVARTDSGARLYVDDELLDVTTDVYASGDEAALAGVFGDGMFRGEAFVEPASQPSIRVNGAWITEQTHALASD